jgi:ABC transporter related protein
LKSSKRIEGGVYDGEDLEYLSDKWELVGLLQSVKEEWFPQVDYSQLISEVSGGEFANLGLARAQIVKPRICLLDEPSNNLDFAGRERLIRYITDFRYTLIAATHDRNIMDCFDKIWEIRDGRLTQIDGSFADYLSHVDNRRAEAAHELSEARKEVKRLKGSLRELEQRQSSRRRGGQRASIEKRGSKMSMNGLKSKLEGTLSRQRSQLLEKRQDAAEAELVAKNNIEDEHGMRLDGLLPDRDSGKRQIICLSSRTGWQTIIGGDDRVALVGANGVGKSRLVASITNSSLRCSGPAWAEPLTPDLQSIGILSQNSLHLDHSKTIWDELVQGIASPERQRVFAVIARLGFSTATPDSLVSELSGGEQFRLSLAKLLLASPPKQLIVLDESTNSLDIQSLREVRDLLSQFEGALLVISHDHDFLESLSLTRWLELSSSGLSELV